MKFSPEDSDSEEQDPDDAMYTSTGREPRRLPGQNPQEEVAAVLEELICSISI